MIYHNSAPVILDLTPDGVIPPLTKCDPNRRRVTGVDVLMAAHDVLSYSYWLSNPRQVRRAEDLAQTYGDLFAQTKNPADAEELFQARERVANRRARVERIARGYGYTGALARLERAKSGAYIA